MHNLKTCLGKTQNEPETLGKIIASKRNVIDKGIIFLTQTKKEKYVSYASLYKKSFDLLRNLEMAGVDAGNALILQIIDPKLFITVLWACLIGNIVPVPLTFGYNKENLKKLLNVRKALTSSHILLERTLLDDIMRLSDTGVKKFINDINAEALCVETNGSIAGTVQKEKKSVAQMDTAYIQFSSGSTGSPKGVVLSHANVIANVDAIIACAAIKRQSSEKTLSWMPLTHDMGLIGFHFTPLFAEIDQLIMQPIGFIRNPNLWLKYISKHRVTLTASPNFGLKYLLDHLKLKKDDGYDLSALRLIFNGGEYISPTLAKKFLETLRPMGLRKNAIFTVYGLAEASLAVTFPKPGHPLKTVRLKRESVKPGQKAIYETNLDAESMEIVSTGKVVTGCDIRITHKERVLCESVVGMIEIRGANVTSGYFGNPTQNRDCFTKEGWLKTGDIGFLSKGELYITGREKDVIIIRGANYYPNDLESIVVDALVSEKIEFALVGIYQKSLENNNVVGFLKWKNTKKPDEFEKLSNKITAVLIEQAGVPIDWIVSVQAIPKTTSGKIKRHTLAEWYQKKMYSRRYKPTETNQDPMAPVGRTGMELSNSAEKVMSSLFRRIFKKEVVEARTPLAHLALDSLEILRIHHELEIQFPGKILISDFFKCHTVGELAKQLSGNRNRQEKVHLNYMSLQPFFLKGNNDRFERNKHFKISIPESVFITIEKICSEKKTTFRDLSIIILLTVLREVSPDPVVSFQSILNEDEILVLYRFSLERVTDFREIISGLRSIQINEYDIDMMPIDRFRYSGLRGSDQHASIILYDRGISSESLEILNNFDIRVGLSVENSRYELYFDCDLRKIPLAALKKLTTLYSDVVHRVVDAYPPLKSSGTL